MYTINSRFISTPFRRTVRYKFDLTAGEKITIPFVGIAGATVRIDVTCWQDEAEQVSKEAITENLKRWGAESVDIRITRLPRENIRADAVLKADTLRDKLIAAAALRDEKVSESILEKSDALEHMDAEELVKTIGRNAPC